MDEGSTYTLHLGAITDPGDDTVTDWIVDWGDESSDTYTSGGDVTHIYADGDNDYTISVDLEDEDGTHAGAGTKVVTVNNVAPTAALGNDGPVDEGSEVTISFSNQSDPSTADTDAGFQYAYACDNGSLDGATYAGSDMAASTTCTFNDDGTYTVRARIIDKDGGYSEYTTDVTVNNVAPQVTANGATIDENGFATVSGEITDPGSQDSFTMVIDWGEGAQSYSYPAGTTGYSEQHQYLDDNPTGTASDVYNISLTVTDDDGGQGTASASIEVNNVPPSVGPINAPTEPVVVGTEVTASASFSDPGLLDTHTAVWDWDDGTTTDPATVTQGTGSGWVEDAHTYLSSGEYTIRLTVTDNDGGEGSETHTLVVQSPSQAIESVVDEVEGLDLPQGLKNALTSKLNNALDDLDRGQDQAAVGKLQAFINSVEAQRGKKISEAEADALIQTAQEIIAAIQAGLL